MRIAHICLSNSFADGFGYQENELVRAHVRLGYEVLVLGSTESFSEKGKRQYVAPREYSGVEGAKVVRLPYPAWMPHVLARKIRAHVGVRRSLELFKPDVLLFHGTCAWDVFTVARFIKHNPSVIAYIDSHSDKYNSAQSFFSREFLHKLFYKPLIHASLDQYKKVLCISKEVMDFAQEIHGIPKDMLEFFPLGGRVLDDEEYRLRRRSFRSRLNVGDDQVVFAVTGRLSKRKQLPEAIRAFSAVQNTRFRLLIAGAIDDDVLYEAGPLIKEDSRIKFIGWCDSDQLTDLLCGADVYLQPGTQSATMQHSLCCRCVVILKDYSSHHPFVDGNGWLVSSHEQLVKIIQSVESADLTSMANRSYSIARKLLDYDEMAKRVLS